MRPLSPLFSTASILRPIKDLCPRPTWSTELRQHLAQDLNNLDADESTFFSDLKEQVAGNNVRLEQEFINWDYAWTIIQRCASKSDVV